MLGKTIKLLKRSSSYFRPSSRPIFLVFLLNIAGTGLALLSPWPIKFIVDGVLSNGEVETNEATRQILGHWLGWASPHVQIIILCILMLAASASTGYVGYLSGRLSLDIGLKAILSIRSHIYEALQYLPLRYHDKASTSDSTYRVAYDSQAIQTIYNGAIIPISTSLLSVIGSLAVMARLNLYLALVSFCVIPPVFLCIKHYTRDISMYSLRRSETESSLLGIAQEALSSIRLVKAHTKEQYELERFLRYAEQSRQSNYLLSRSQLKSGVVITFMMSTGTTILYLVGSTQILNQTLTLGGVLVFVAYLNQLYHPIEQLTNVAGTLAGASASLSRSFEIIDQHNDHERDVALPPIMITAGQINFSDITFSYADGSRVLNHMNLVVQPGEVVAVVGETGQGKSTILSLLTRFYEADSGRILLDGLDISSFSKSSLRKSISIVLQDTVLFSASIAENIRYGRSDASLNEVKEAAVRAEAYDFILGLPHGFNTQIGERGGRLSGGQRQRIAIARAFLRDTPILLLDEPTSALDTITETRISHAMYELMKSRTTLLVTHRLSLADRADKVAVLHSGSIVEIGHPMDLRNQRGYYSSLRSSQDMHT